jgi:hypothetical protein
VKVTFDLTQEYVSLGEAALNAGVTPAAVALAAREGRIEFVATPLGRLFPLEAVEEYAQEREARLRGER